MSTEKWEKNTIGAFAAVGVFLLFLVAYWLPRSATLRQSRESVQKLQSVRQEVAVLLPEVARTVPTTPMPTPDVRSWVTANALKGIEKNVVANDGYLQNKGAQLKLRRLSPNQTAQFLSSLTRARLSVDRMQLQDSDGDGRWDMEISLKVPQ